MTWDVETSAWLLLKRKEALSPFLPLNNPLSFEATGDQEELNCCAGILK